VRRAVLASLAVLSPLLLAARDPAGDVGPCPPGAGGTGDPRIDIVEARGEIVERGTALRFTIGFADAFEAPDGEGTPLRVDVVLRDPDVPTVSFRYYRDLNRIVRFDAVPDPALQIVLLPEEGANVSLGAVALGDTVTMTLPGRLVTRDADLEGLGLERLRWGVIARDEGDCDALGDGRPVERLAAEVSPTPHPTPDPTDVVAQTPGAPASASDSDPAPSGAAAWALLGGVVASISALAIVVVRRNTKR
jgi:hypothetical protein